MDETLSTSLGRAHTLYVFGDSHGLCLDMRVYHHLGQTYAFREMFVPLFRASSLVVENGELPPKLARALKDASLTWSVSGVQRPAHTADDSWIRHIAYMRDVGHEDPVLIFSLGFIELADFSSQLAKANVNVESHDALVLLFTQRLRSFADTLLALKARGFNRLAILAIAPFTPSDGAFAAVLETVDAAHDAEHVYADWRKAMFRIGNEALEIVARQTGATFVASLPDHEHDGLAANGVLADGLHYSPWALDRVAHRAIELMYANFEQPPVLPPPSFYQIYLDLETIPQMTIATATFEAIRAAAPDTILPLEDVNERTVVWTSTSRILYIAGIR